MAVPTTPNTTWADGPGGGTPLSAARLNVIEARVSEGISGFEYTYDPFTSTASVTATTEATANVIVTAATITFDGATAIIIDYSAQDWDHTGIGVIAKLWLYDSIGGGAAASIGEFWRMSSLSTGDAGGIRQTRRLTPSANTHQFSIRGSTGSGTMRQIAGAGGAGNQMPGFIRITKA